MVQMRPYMVVMRFAALVLASTGILKLLDSLGQHDYYQEQDALFFFLNNRQIILLAGALELGLAAFLWLEKSLQQSSLALIWFCSILATYKLGLVYTYNIRPCSCLGILGRLLKMSNRQLELATWLLLLCLIFLAIATLSESRRIGDPQGKAQVANGPDVGSDGYAR